MWRCGGNAVNKTLNLNEGVDFVVSNTDARLVIPPRPFNCKSVPLTNEPGAGANRMLAGMQRSKTSLWRNRRRADGIHHRRDGWWYRNRRCPSLLGWPVKGALTVGVVTKPFNFEGRPSSTARAISRRSRLRSTPHVIPNQRLLSICDESTTMMDAFGVADRVLYNACGNQRFDH